MEFPSSIKRVVFKFVFTALTCCVLLWLSVFTYGLIYYSYIPAVAHVKPVYLRYDTSCSKEKVCAFPYDNITLVEKGHNELLSTGQAYAIELVLDMPESEHNLQHGMFMIHLDMLSHTGEVVKSSRRPTLLRYRSPLFKIIYTLFFVPALLAGTVEEKQSISVPLFEKYVEDHYQRTYYAFVEIEALTVEVYSCSLKIHAQFTGLRYMMYYWPVLSAVIGIGTNFFFFSILVIFIWVRQIMNTSQFISIAKLSEREQDLVNEIRQSVQKNQAQKALDMQTQNVGITRRGESEGTNTGRAAIEDISPYDELPRNTSPRLLYQERSPTQVQASISFEEDISDERFAQEYVSGEIDNILDTSPVPEPAQCNTSPAVRRRITTD